MRRNTVYFLHSSATQKFRFNYRSEKEKRENKGKKDTRTTDDGPENPAAADSVVLAPDEGARSYIPGAVRVSTRMNPERKG
jgi:hypothetical protein